MVHPKTLLGACSRRAAGFTLIEVMIVVVIIALLATIAVPSYLDYVRKTRRADAITRISQVQQAQERFRANNPAYTANLKEAPPAGLGIPDQTSDGHYKLSLSVDPDTPDTSYTVLAEATGAQTKDTNCRFMSLTMTRGNAELKSGPNNPPANKGAAANRCWNR